MARFRLIPVPADSEEVEGEDGREPVDLPDDGSVLELGRNAFAIKHPCISRKAVRIFKQPGQECFQVQNIAGKQLILRDILSSAQSAHSAKKQQIVEEGKSMVLKVGDAIELVLIEEISFQLFQREEMKRLGDLARNPHRYVLVENTNSSKNVQDKDLLLQANNSLNERGNAQIQGRSNPACAFDSPSKQVRISSKSTPHEIAEWISKTVLSPLSADKASAISDVICREEIDGEAVLALALSNDCDFAGDFKEFVQLISAELSTSLGYGHVLKLKSAVRSLDKRSAVRGPGFILSTGEDGAHDQSSNLQKDNSTHMKDSSIKVIEDRQSILRAECNTSLERPAEKHLKKRNEAENGPAVTPLVKSKESSADIGIFQSPPTVQRTGGDDGPRGALPYSDIIKAASHEQCGELNATPCAVNEDKGTPTSTYKRSKPPADGGFHSCKRRKRSRGSTALLRPSNSKAPEPACSTKGQGCGQDIDKGAQADTESETDDDFEPVLGLNGRDDEHLIPRDSGQVDPNVHENGEPIIQSTQDSSQNSAVRNLCNFAESLGKLQKPCSASDGDEDGASSVSSTDIAVSPAKKRCQAKLRATSAAGHRQSEQVEESDTVDEMLGPGSDLDPDDVEEVAESAIAAHPGSLSTELDAMFAGLGAEALPAVDLPPKMLSVQLKFHQKQALGWMLDTEARPIKSDNLPRGGILADDQGFGKTISVLALVMRSLDSETKAKAVNQLLGKRIRRQFMTGEFIGLVKSHSTSTGYRIVYTDGDQEDMEADEILPLLVVEKEGSKNNSQKCSCGVDLDRTSTSIQKDVIRCTICTARQHLSCASSGNPELLDLVPTLDNGYSFVCRKCSEAATCTKPLDAPFTTLVVAPASVVTQWQEEAETKSNGKLRVLLYHGACKQKAKAKDRGPGDLTAYHLVITTYSTLKQEAPEEEVKNSGIANKGGGPLYKVNWRRVVLDEAHTIRNLRTKTFRACEWLGASSFWCLTGTPIVNGLADLIAYCRFISGGRHAWLPARIKELAGSSKKDKADFSGVQRLLSPLLLRRTKRTMVNGRPMLELPQRVVVVKSDMRFSEREAELYRRLSTGAREQFLRMVRKGWKENIIHILALLVRLRQFCNHPTLLPDETLRVISDDTIEAAAEAASAAAASAGNMALGGSSQQVLSKRKSGELQRSVSRAFLPLLAAAASLARAEEQGDEEESAALSDVEEEMLQRALGNLSGKDLFDGPSAKQTAILGEVNALASLEPATKILIFSQFPSFFDLLGPDLERAGHPNLQVTGKMTLQHRRDVISRFRSDPAVRVLLLSTRAASLGLNLTVANRVIIVDPWWNSACEDQAIDRAHRIGQTRDVHVTKFILSGTVEENILRVQEYKDGVARRLLNESGAAPGAATGARPKLTLKDLNILFGVETPAAAAARRQLTTVGAAAAVAAGSSAAQGRSAAASTVSARSKSQL